MKSLKYKMGSEKLEQNKERTIGFMKTHLGLDNYNMKKVINLILKEVKKIK